MIALGIEGTAHTFGVGAVDGLDDPTILANHTRMYRPEEGGIHPREAARHHADVASDAVETGLDEAGLAPEEVDVVAFSQGPGLGPCLRTAATAARALSLRLDVPLVGVNHCVAHQEIGRAVTAARDPVLLYASGANTQVIGYAADRYRLYGETLDVGVGNMLDKFAREAGLPFPGGPAIEEAAEGVDEVVDLPYSVKGMDVAFSGLLTAALEARDEASMAVLANSIQETAFATLVEVAERALAHAGKDEVVLGGGVACNDRLREMTETMARERGAEAYAPEPALCVDNGAMIAYTGLLAREAGASVPVEESAIDQGWRTDEATIPWRGQVPGRATSRAATDALARGAEAVIKEDTYLGRDVVRKRRPPKGYRHPELDGRLRLQRARLEARLLREARSTGVRTPLVYAVAPDDATLVLERIPGPTLREALHEADPEGARELLEALGATVARLHAGGLVHGDLTTSNVLVPHREEPELALIDLGLSGRSGEAEDAGVDLRVLFEALEATHADLPSPHAPVLEGYRRVGGRAGAVAKLDEIAARGRYKEQAPAGAP
jgi:N6-L-threonylcarbamoyladenine synthase/protein kinase Bud32